MTQRTYDVTAEYESYFDSHLFFEHSGVPVIGYAPVKMAPAERLMLWSLAYTLRPSTYLEIGSLHGGSALIVASALDTLGAPGRLALIEPEPQIAPEVWARLATRSTLVRGFSPGAIAEAVAALAEPVELAFIDGDHGYAGALADATGLLPHLAPGAYVLFHDCFFDDVRRAIDDFVAAHADRVVDCGAITREVTSEITSDGRKVLWGGLRMLRHRAS